MSRNHQFAVVSACFLLMLTANTSRGQALTNIVFVAFDTETTGLDPKSDRIIEIGAVKFRNGHILEATNWLVNPGIPIPVAARKINGITDKMVSGCPAFKEVFPDFVAFVQGSVLLAHNARFDVGLLSTEIARNGLQPPENYALDTLHLARKWFPDAKSFELDKLARHLGIAAERFHRSGDDASCLVQIFMKGLDHIPPDSDIEHLIALAGGKLRFAKSRLADQEHKAQQN
jgi:DNA polymerase III epsilon subunit